MYKNTAVQIATGKLAGVSLLPGSLILIGGVVVFQLYKQAQLQTQTSELIAELKAVKKQIAEIKATNKADSESITPVTSFLKEKVSRFNFPWSASK